MRNMAANKSKSKNIPANAQRNGMGIQKTDKQVIKQLDKLDSTDSKKAADVDTDDEVTPGIAGTLRSSELDKAFLRLRGSLNHANVLMEQLEYRLQPVCTKPASTTCAHPEEDGPASQVAHEVELRAEEVEILGARVQHLLDSLGM